MKSVVSMTCCAILMTLLISGESLLSIAQDEHTVLLYTFESGAGNTVKDLSGNGNDGDLMGPKWGKATQAVDSSLKEMDPEILWKSPTARV